AILPHVEQESVFRQRSWTVAIATYVCPARREVAAHTIAPADNYGTYESGGWAWPKTDYAGNPRIFPNYAPGGAKCLSISSVTDGTSQTILAGEKAIDPSIQTPSSWYWDEPFF